MSKWNVSTPLVKGKEGKLYVTGIVAQKHVVLLVDDRDADDVAKHLNAKEEAASKLYEALADFGVHKGDSNEFCVEYEDGTCACGLNDTFERYQPREEA